MVDRVVQRPFLLWVAEAASRADKGKPDKPLPAGAAEVTGPELAEVKRALTQSVARERGKPVVHPKSQGGRRGAYAAPIDHLAYFPRDPLLSITHSAVEEFLEQHASKRLRPVTEKEGRRGGGGSWSPVADYILDIPADAIPGEQEQNRRLGGVGEITDPRWIISVAAMGWRKLKHRHELRDSPAPPHRLAENARVIAVGDWAIGSKRARPVAHQIREVLDADDSNGRDCHVIHLGDTYYGGWDREYRKRFLPHWPVREGEPRPRRHGRVLADPPPPARDRQLMPKHGVLDLQRAGSRGTGDERSSSRASRLTKSNSTRAPILRTGARPRHIAVSAPAGRRIRVFDPYTPPPEFLQNRRYQRHCFSDLGKRGVVDAQG
jgi:hypothetical protein